MAQQLTGERIITARFHGHCRPCDQEIRVGQQIAWAKGQETRHADCPPVSITRAPALAPASTAARKPRRPVYDNTPAHKRPLPECRCGQTCTEIIRGACCRCRRDRDCCQFCDI